MMRAVVQRVERAAVTVGGKNISSIQQGLVAFVGVEKGDTTKDADCLVDKIINLRIFEDSEGKMNLSLLAKNGEFMVIYFVVKSRDKVDKVGTGEFQAMMKIDLRNDGPVTLLLDSRTAF